MSMTPSRAALERVTLADLAADNRIFVVRCHLCRKTEHYLATDMVNVMGAGRRAVHVFQTCPHCGKSEYLRVETRLPLDSDKGKLRLRRPVSYRISWSWADAIYEPGPPLPDFWNG